MKLLILTIFAFGVSAYAGDPEMEKGVKHNNPTYKADICKNNAKTTGKYEAKRNSRSAEKAEQ